MRGKRPVRGEEKKRVPLGQRNVLSFNNMDPGFQYRVINDVDDRLERAVNAGYEFVEGDAKIGDEMAGDPEQMDSRVTKHVGNGTTGYLMRIKKEWYKEDQIEKQKEVDERVKSLTPDMENQGLTTTLGREKLAGIKIE